MTGILQPGSTIGIIGGGQLGRMLAMAAARFSYRTVILEPDERCPASQLANRHIAAPYDEEAALAELVRECDVITYEFENVPLRAARWLSGRRPVYPPPLALEKSQDRLAEKIFLQNAGVPTAQFAKVDNDRELAAALEQFNGHGILKTRRLGYDGKGQRWFTGEIPKPDSGIYLAMGEAPLILESVVPFTLEFSVIAVRGADGSFQAYDPAENLHREGILRSSIVPGSVPGEAAEIARKHVFELSRRLDYVGVTGVEFFLLQDGSVVANEFAPRVHNSGHWTEAACAISQFEQHIRAIAGLPLGATTRHSDCVMSNLIGHESADIASLAARPDAVIHLYGKAEARKGRKMGHLTELKPRI